MTHTPGPWEVHFAHDVTGYPCYYIHGFAGEQKRDATAHEANARLIAAAPDLLAALKELLRHIVNQSYITPQFKALLDDYGAEIPANVMIAARDAIAKAEAGQ